MDYHQLVLFWHILTQCLALLFLLLVERWHVPLIISRTISTNSGADSTMQATPYDFNNYLPVFQNTLTFKASASFENATFASKIAVDVLLASTDCAMISMYSLFHI